jgi:HK97 family phage major capsid protein
MPDLTEKITELGTLITNIQKGNDALEKKFDSIKNEEVKKMTEKATELAEGFQKEKENREKDAEKIANLEKQIVLMGNRDSKGNPVFGEYSNQFSRYMKKGVAIDSDLVGKVNEKFIRTHYKGLTEDQIQNEIKSLSVQINPDGGYWVKPEMLSETVDRTFETSPMRTVATVMQTATSGVELIIDDNEATSGGWVGEKTARPETATPKIGLLEIKAHEQYANPAATQKMIDDAGFNIEAWLADKISDKFTRDENTSFVTGDGNMKPKGFLSYSAWASAGTYERDALEQLDSGSNGDFDADDLIDLQMLLKEAYQPNAVWLMQRLTWGKVIKLKEATTGAYLIDPQLIKTGTDLRLLGQLVTFASDMAATGATGALSVAYGDFKKGYSIIDRLGIRTLRDPYSNKPFVNFYTTKRVGGAVTNYESIKILKESA